MSHNLANFALVFTLFSAHAALAQVVQLPEMHQFSASTTVSVPDYGGTYLGGVSRAASGQVTRGIPGLGPLAKQRAIGKEVSHTGVSAHATIIDHAEHDELLLTTAKSKTTATPPLVLAPVPVAPEKNSAAPSLAAIRAELAAEGAEREAAAQVVFDKALACEQRGELRLAKTYYLLAMKKSPAVVKQKAASQLQELMKKMAQSQSQQ